jgi:hypothetical protein
LYFIKWKDWPRWVPVTIYIDDPRIL